MRALFKFRQTGMPDWNSQNSQILSTNETSYFNVVRGPLLCPIETGGCFKAIMLFSCILQPMEALKRSKLKFYVSALLRSADAELEQPL